MDAEWTRNEAVTRRNNGDAARLKELLLKSIDERAPASAALLFSGGVDSALLAMLLNERTELHCYCAAAREAKDWAGSAKAAELLGLELTRIELTEATVERELPEIVATVGTNIMRVGVAVPIWFCSQAAKEKAVFFGMGTEELFAGYKRHRELFPDYAAIEKECWSGLEQTWTRDVSRDVAVCARFGKEPFFPYLDKAFVEEAMALPTESKIDAEHNKLALRRMAVELGLPAVLAFAPKKAAQYGSWADKYIHAIAKRQGKTPVNYLSTLAAKSRPMG